MKIQAFRSSEDSFSIGYDNGTLVSVYFGQGSYSDNGDSTCEVACFDKDGKWLMYDFESKSFISIPSGSEIHPRITPEQLSEIMYQISKL